MSTFDCSLLEEQHFQTSDSLKDGAISCSDWSRFAIASSTGFTLLTFSGHSSRKVQLFTVSWFQLDQHLEQDDLRYYTYTPLALFCPDSLRPDGARLLAVASSTGQLVICDANQESPVVLFNVSKRWRSQLDERNSGTGVNPGSTRKTPTSNGTASTGAGLSRDEEALLGRSAGKENLSIDCLNIRVSAKNRRERERGEKPWFAFLFSLSLSSRWGDRGALLSFSSPRLLFLLRGKSLLFSTPEKISKKINSCLVLRLLLLLLEGNGE